MRTINDGFPIKQFNGIDIDTSIQSSSANYYTYSSRLVKFIVIHYTGNKKDTAKNNATFFHNGARNRLLIILWTKPSVINQLR